MKHEEIANAGMELAMFVDASNRLLKQLNLEKKAVLHFTPGWRDSTPDEIEVCQSNGVVLLRLEA